jgi:hypothetical protein
MFIKGDGEMIRLVNVQLETGSHENLRSNVRLMSIGNNEILILNGKFKGLKAKVISVTETTF